MGDSLKHPHLSHKRQAPQARQPCDYCGDSTAILYCGADSAKLCFSCDRGVHSTNQLFSKHIRTLLCDACDDCPATILCSTERSVLCQNCDWERHTLSLSSTHDRRPLEGFNGCPSVIELLTILGLKNLDKKALYSTEESEGCGGAGDGFLGSELEVLSDMLLWDAPAVANLDDLASTTGSSHNYQAMDVPPLPKNRKAAYGRHREEIISQLGELAKLEPNLKFENIGTERLSSMHPSVPEQHVQPGNFSASFERDIDVDIFPSYELGEIRWHKDNSEPANQVVPTNKSLRTCTEEAPDKHLVSAVTGSHTYGNNGRKSQNFNYKALSSSTRVAPLELTSQERGTAILRYKEKRKMRRYEKYIRYESRKVRAESRIRIKGRFARVDH